MSVVALLNILQVSSDIIVSLFVFIVLTLYPQRQAKKEVQNLKNDDESQVHRTKVCDLFHIM